MRYGRVAAFCFPVCVVETCIPHIILGKNSKKNGRNKKDRTALRQPPTGTTPPTVNARSAYALFDQCFHTPHIVNE